MSSLSRKVEMSKSAYFLGHWLVPILAFACVGISMGCLQLEYVPTFRSATLSVPFDSHLAPFYAAQVADLHLVKSVPELMDSTERKLRNITEKFNPAFLTIAGDLASTRDSTSDMGAHHQFDENWDAYNLTKYRTGVHEEGRTVFEVAGNHDLMHVSHDDNEHNRFRRYTMNPGARFNVVSHEVEEVYSVPVNIITFNPLRPPFTAGPMGVMPCVHEDDVEALNAALRDDKKNIILTHFPMTHLWNIGGESNLNIRTVIHRSDLFLSAHVHPSTTEIARRNGTLSVISQAMITGKEVTMSWIDNGGAGVKVIETTDEDVVMVTYPLPRNQLNGRSVFNLRTFPIRVLTFSREPMDLPVMIDGEMIGKMIYRRTIRRNVHFYTLDDVNVEDGSHLLRIGSDEMEFFVGERTSPTIQIADRLQAYGPPIWSGFAFFVVCWLMIVPWWKIGNLLFWLEEFDKEMYEGGTNLSIFSVICLSVPYFLSRMRKVSTTLKGFSVLMMTWFLVIPLYITKSDQERAIIWIWGARIMNTFTHYAMTGTLLFLYELTFVFFSFQLIGFWFERSDGKAWTRCQWIEFAICCLMMSGGISGWCLLGIIAGGWKIILSSPMTVIEIMTILLYTYVFVSASACKHQPPVTLGIQLNDSSQDQESTEEKVEKGIMNIREEGTANGVAECAA